MGELEEFEAAMAQVFGETANGESMNYIMFRSTVQHMVRSAVPEWYHVSMFVIEECFFLFLFCFVLFLFFVLGFLFLFLFCFFVFSQNSLSPCSPFLKKNHTFVFITIYGMFFYFISVINS